MSEVQILKVKKDSPVTKVAAAVAELVREGKQIELHAIGAGSVNQSVKALATARSYVASNGFNLSFTPGFILVQIEDNDRTGIKFIVNY